MNCKLCGNSKFYAHQILHMDIICDEQGEFLNNIHPNDPMTSCYEAEKPFGPFTCTRCGAIYDRLSDKSPIENLTILYAPIQNDPDHLAVLDHFYIYEHDNDVDILPARSRILAPNARTPLHKADMDQIITNHFVVSQWTVQKTDGLKIITAGPFTQNK